MAVRAVDNIGKQERTEDRAHSTVATMTSTDRCRQQRDSLQHKTHRIMQGATRNHAINDVHAETLRFCMFTVAAQKRKATRRNLVQQTPRRGLLATVVTHECNLQWRRSLHLIALSRGCGVRP